MFNLLSEINLKDSSLLKFIQMIVFYAKANFKHILKSYFGPFLFWRDYFINVIFRYDAIHITLL